MAADQSRAIRFRSVAGELELRHGVRVYKVSLHSGLGCPNRDRHSGNGGCSFCAQPALQPVGYRAGQGIAEQLAEGMAYIRRRHGAERFVAYYQDYCGTYGPPATLRELYQPALAVPEVVELAVSTRPDCLEPAVLELLSDVADAKPLWVELGLQIADDHLLEDLNRGHTTADFTAAVSTLHSRGLRVCAHVILGLPGATPETERRTAELLALLGVWGVKLHAFHILRGTEMERRHRAGGLPLLSLDQHAHRVVDFVERLPDRVVIHRITAEASRRLTVAPLWTDNKLAAHGRVLAAFATRNTWQGRHALRDQPSPRASQ